MKWGLPSVFAGLFASAMMIGTARAERHEPSGLLLPDRIADMTISANPKGIFGDYARQYTFSNGADRIEISVFKAAYPNVSIWFRDRQWRAEGLLAAGHPTLSAVETISAGSKVPNALAAQMSFDAHYTSAAIATIGFGDWIVDVLTVSKSLDQNSQRRRLDEILRGIRQGTVQERYGPVSVIERCANGRESGWLAAPQRMDVTTTLEEATIAGLLARLSSQAASLRSDTLAPAGLCWAATDSGRIKWFAEKSPRIGLTWLSTLPGGWTVESWAVPKVPGTSAHAAAILVNDAATTKVAGLSKDVPYPPYILPQAMIAALAPSRIASVNRSSGIVSLVKPD